MRASLMTGLLLVGLTIGCGWKLETRGVLTEQVGAPAEAPAFSLANDNGVHVSLDELLAGGKPAILVFYRGHW